MAEGLEMICFKIISNVGSARSSYIEAIQKAKKGDFDGARAGFFYKNPAIRKEIDRVMEQQTGMPDPRRSILDMAMDSEIELLRRQKEALAAENEQLKKENELLKKSLAKKSIGILKNL